MLSGGVCRNFWGFMGGVCRFKPAVVRTANKCSTKASTGRTGIALHMQTKLPTSNIPDRQGVTLRASVRTEKTKSPGGWVGLSAHVKVKNGLHIAKRATCSSELWSRQKMLFSLLPTASIRTSIQRTGVQTGCRSQGRQMQHKSKHRTNRHCIPHADQAANPYTSECEDHRRRQANLGRNSRQIKRFGSPFQAACRRLTLSVTSPCV